MCTTGYGWDELGSRGVDRRGFLLRFQSFEQLVDERGRVALQEILQVRDHALSKLAFGDVGPDEGKHVVGKDICISVGTASVSVSLSC